MKKFVSSIMSFLSLMCLVFLFASTPSIAASPDGPKVTRAYTNDTGTEIFVEFDQDLDTTITIPKSQIELRHKNSNRVLEKIEYSSPNTINIKIDFSVTNKNRLLNDGLTTIRINADTVFNENGDGNEFVPEMKVESQVPPYTVSLKAVIDGNETEVDEFFFFQSDHGDTTFTFDAILEVRDPDGEPVEGLTIEWRKRDNIGNMALHETQTTDENGVARFDGIELSSATPDGTNFQYLAMSNAPQKMMVYVPEGYALLRVNLTDVYSGFLDPVDETGSPKYENLFDGYSISGTANYMVLDPDTTTLAAIIETSSPAYTKVTYARIPVDLQSDEYHETTLDNMSFRDAANATILTKPVSPLDDDLIWITDIKLINADDPDE